MKLQSAACNAPIVINSFSCDLKGYAVFTLRRAALSYRAQILQHAASSHLQAWHGMGTEPILCLHFSSMFWGVFCLSFFIRGQN